jgi:hypothetical protein
MATPVAAQLRHLKISVHWSETVMAGICSPEWGGFEYWPASILEPNLKIHFAARNYSAAQPVMGAAEGTVDEVGRLKKTIQKLERNSRNRRRPIATSPLNARQDTGFQPQACRNN